MRFTPEAISSLKPLDFISEDFGDFRLTVSRGYDGWGVEVWNMHVKRIAFGSDRSLQYAVGSVSDKIHGDENRAVLVVGKCWHSGRGRYSTSVVFC